MYVKTIIKVSEEDNVNDLDISAREDIVVIHTDDKQKITKRVKEI